MLLTASFGGAELATPPTDLDDDRKWIEVEVDACDMGAVRSIRALDRWRRDRQALEQREEPALEPALHPRHLHHLVEHVESGSSPAAELSEPSLHHRWCGEALAYGAVQRVSELCRADSADQLDDGQRSGG